MSASLRWNGQRFVSVRVAYEAPRRDAISEAFEATRRTIEQLEAERDAREQWLAAWRPSDGDAS